MKRMITVAALCSILYISCTGGNNNPVGIAGITKDSTIQWIDSVVNFGTIKMGEQVKVAFRIRNIGKQPLFITAVKAGCGCTVPDYTREAIAPGAEGVVTGAFDSNKSQPGEVRKSIFVTTNTFQKTDHTLIFTGLIKEADDKKQ